VSNAHVNGGSVAAAYREAVAKIDAIVKKLKKGGRGQGSGVRKRTHLKARLKSNFTQAAYEQAVLKAKEYIKAGDIFQVVPSQRFERKVTAEPFEIYRALRLINPSPYMYFLRCGDTTVVGASPEVMVRLEEDRIDLRPIAGTRRRGATEEEDKALEQELLADPKERAEHIMLVDLGRNDVGRVSEMGSVQVSELMVIERYSHVMHIVSNVRGRIAPDHDAYDVVRACFPAGTDLGRAGAHTARPLCRGRGLLRVLRQHGHLHHHPHAGHQGQGRLHPGGRRRGCRQRACAGVPGNGEQGQGNVEGRGDGGGRAGLEQRICNHGFRFAEHTDEHG